MKHRLTKLVVFLLLGAIINVAVAWGCALPHHDRGIDSRVYSVDKQLWNVRIQRHFGSVRRTYMGKLLLIVDNRGEIISAESEPDRYNEGPMGPIEPIPRQSLHRILHLFGYQGNAFEQLNGWPLYSLAGHGKIGYKPPNHMMAVDYGSLLFIGGVRPSSSNTYRRGGVLPFRLIWLGFALNTFFYAAILWLLMFGPSTARRFIRRKRGHCINCGYDLRGDFSVGCPECGWRREAEA